MGFLSRFMTRADEPLAASVLARTAEPSATFDAITASDIPPEFFGLSSYSDVLAPAPRVDRRSALQIPAVKRGRDLIAGALGSLPIKLQLDGVDVPASSPFGTFLRQPEIGVPRSVTMARTYEDMLFEGCAWWLVTETNWTGYPSRIKRLDPRSVDVRKDGHVYITKAGHHGSTVEYADDFDLIRFDSPNEPLLVSGARAIRTCLALDAAANRYANGNQPLDYFSPAEGVDEDPEKEDLDKALDAWEAARRQRATGYVPAGLKYNTAGWDPEKLQLADARQHAVLEIARVLGIDAEDLGVSTTSRTYQNSQDRYQSRIKDTLRAYHVAFEERLSMNDVNPRGYVAMTDFSDYLRADDLGRFNAYDVGLRVGAYADKNEVRTAERKPLVDGWSSPTPAESPAPAAERQANV